MRLDGSHAPAGLNRDSASCMEQQSTGDTLIITEGSANSCTKGIFLIMISILSVIAVSVAADAREPAAGVTMAVILAVTAAAIALRVSVNIDRSRHVVIKTWDLAGFTYQRKYPLQACSRVTIINRSGLMEGHLLPYFLLRLTGTGAGITVYSTSDYADAELMKQKISGFLGIIPPRHV